MLKEKLQRKLQDSFSPDCLEVIDEGIQHRGHKATGGHFRVVIVSKNFSGKSSLERHRMIHAILEEELKGEIHALSIKACTPEEWNKNEKGIDIF